MVEHTDKRLAGASTGAMCLQLEPLSWKIWQKKRYIVIFMTFLGLFNAYALRLNLSVGIVAMTENRTVHYENGTIGYEQEFPWDSKDRGLILSSFFWGYITTQLLGGLFAAKFGGNLIFGIGIAVTSVLTLLTPFAAKAGVYTLFAMRTVEGIFEGVAFPAMYAILSRWAPPLERSRMATIVIAGMNMGTVVSMPVSGLLAEYYGWESIFYVFGVVGCIWFILWLIIVREGPEKDKYISKNELRYIQNCLNANQNNSSTNVKLPWKNFFTSKPVYAIGVAHFAETWGFYTMVTQLPSFLADTLGFELDKAGFLAGVPYLIMSTLLFFNGYIADACQIKGYLTTSQVRRYFNCGGFLVQTIFLVIAAYVMNPIITVMSIILFVGFGAFAWCGFAVNHLDIAPQYASVLMGMSNTLATVPGIVTPALTGFIVVHSTREEWQIVFLISAAIYLIASCVYWYWASSEIQPWALEKPSESNAQKPLSTVAIIGIDGFEMGVN